MERGVADDRQGDAACLLCGGSLTSACVSTGRAQPLFPGNTARPQMTGDGTKQAVCQTATHQIISRPGPRSSPDPLIASNSSKIAPRRRRSGPPPPRATPGRSDRPGEIRRRTSQRIGGSRLATAARPIGQSSGRLGPSFKSGGLITPNSSRTNSRHCRLRLVRMAIAPAHLARR